MVLRTFVIVPRQEQIKSQAGYVNSSKERAINRDLLTSNLLTENELITFQMRNLILKESQQLAAMMDTITIVGLIAAVLTTMSFLPQVMKVWKTKSTRDISTGMFMLSSSGLFLWFIYGVYIKDLPIILANSLSLIQALIILSFKFRYK